MAEINIVIATHGNFGIELLNSAEMIIGKTDNVYNVSLEPGMSFENFTSIAQKLLDSLSGPILTLVDLFGGTPSNVMTFLSRKRSQKIIAGVNLPMFIDLYLKLSNNEVFD
ncbi:MAG: PTS mannose transporter subunit IIAB, partial [Liquorilactobacillus satsumensis]